MRLRNEGLAREVREAQTCRARSPKQGLKVLQPQSADVLEVTLPQYKAGRGHVRDRQVPCTDPRPDQPQIGCRDSRHWPSSSTSFRAILPQDLYTFVSENSNKFIRTQIFTGCDRL